MSTQARVCGRDFLDGIPNAPGHGRPRAFGSASQRPCAAAETERSGEVLDNLIEFLSGTLGAASVMRGIGLVDLQLELPHACRELAARTLVEHGHISAGLGGSI